MVVCLCGALGATRPAVRVVEMRSPRRHLWRFGFTGEYYTKFRMSYAYAVKQRKRIRRSQTMARSEPREKGEKMQFHNDMMPQCHISTMPQLPWQGQSPKVLHNATITLAGTVPESPQSFRLGETPRPTQRSQQGAGSPLQVILDAPARMTPALAVCAFTPA